SSRYLLAITPFAIYFAAQAVASMPLAGGFAPRLAGVLLAAVALQHVTQLPDQIGASQRFDDAGHVVDGPADAEAQAAFDAVREHTAPHAVVAFFKARAMTLYTGRRSVQSDRLDAVLQHADYFMMMRHSGHFDQPSLSGGDAARFGL